MAREDIWNLLKIGNCHLQKCLKQRKHVASPQGDHPLKNKIRRQPADMPTVSDWSTEIYMIFYMFQCHSPKSSHPLPLPQSP